VLAQSSASRSRPVMFIMTAAHRPAVRRLWTIQDQGQQHELALDRRRRARSPPP
jgi:hypothetical protein